MANNPKFVVDIEANLKDLDRGVDRIKKELADIEKQSSNMGFGDDVKEQIQEALAELQKFRDETVKTFKELSQGKLNTTEFNKFIKEFETKMSLVNKRFVSIEETIAKFSKQIDKIKGIGELGKKVANLQTLYNNLTNTIKNSTSALKEFEKLINTKSSDSGVKSRIKDYEKLASVLENIDFGSGKTTLKTTDLKKLEKQFDSLYTKYGELDAALSDSEDPQFITKTQKEIGELLPQLANVFNAIVKIRNISDFGEYGGGSQMFEKIGLSFGDIANELNTASGNIQESISQMVLDLKSSVKDASDEIGSATATMFAFKDGKIQIPVILDENSIKKLRPKYKELIDLLQQYADTNPVDVTMRLFPLNTTKKGQAEVKDAIKNINAQIADLPEGELKTSMTTLYDNLEKQYQKALTLKIAVELSEDAHSVSQNIKHIQEAVNEEGITIYPEIVITDEESEKLSNKLKELQEGFTFNITSEIKEMANSLNALLKQDKTEEWVDNFISGLNKIEEKLKEIEPLINNLSNIVATKNGKTKNTPTQNDVNIILEFTEAMKSLRQTMDNQKELKVEINTSEILRKIDVIKTHFSLVVGQLMEIQTRVSQLANGKIVGDKVSEKIQEEVDKSDPIKIPITPDLSSINSFISQIESAISKFDVKLSIGEFGLSSTQSNSLKDALQDNDKANDLYHKMYYGLDAISENLGDNIKRTIAEALVRGLRDGVSSTADMLRNGLKGTEFESITEQIIGDEETLNNIRKVANDVAIAFSNSLNTNDSSIDNFISDIESKIVSGGKSVHIPISVMESSIDGFIKEAQSIIDAKVDIADDSNNNSNNNKQITNLNRRINNLKDKIDLVWKTWIDGATKGTNTALDGINKVIAKLADLATKLSNISDKFKGFDFSDKLSDAANLIFNGNRSDSDIGEIVSQMMDADKIMQTAGRELRERAFYYNLQNGKHTNTYTFDDTHSYGLKRNLLVNDDIKNYDTHVHTHPEKYASMSLAVLDEKTKKISGDILAFYNDYLNGINTQIIAAQKNVEIFDAKKFYDDNKDIFKNKRELGKELLAAKEKVVKSYKDDIQKHIEALELSGLSYDDLVLTKDNRDIFDDSSKHMSKETTGYSIRVREALKKSKYRGDHSAILQDYFESQKNNPELKFSQFLTDIIDKNVNKKGLKGLGEFASTEDFNTYIKQYANKVSTNLWNNIFRKTWQEFLGLITPDILKEVGINDFDSYVTRMPIEEFREKYSGIAQVSDAQVTEESTKATDKESQAMGELYDKAIAAAEAKEKFVNANKEVFESIITSLSALNSEGDGFANLNKLINNLGGKSGDEKLQKTVEGLKSIYEVLNQDIGDNALLKVLDDLASKGTDLENLATVLKATKKQISTAKEEIDTSNQDNLKSIMKSVDVSGNARSYLSEYGEVVNLTQELKNGFIQVTSTVLAADDTFKRYTLTTKDGVEMTISKTEEHTTGLEKEINLYAKLLRAANRLKALDEPNPRSTDEVFIEKDSALWNDVLEYAKEYGEDLGNILSITRSVREANGEMLESFKIVGENGSVTIGAENDVVGSIQKIQDVTKQYKELLDLRNKLSSTDLKNTQKESFTPEYISQIREMINLIDSAEFDLTNPADVARLEKMVADAKELDAASKNMDNTLGNMKQLDKLRGKIADILNDYGAMPRELKDNFNSLKSTVEYFIKAGRISSAQADEINAKFLELNANLSESGKKYQSLGRQMLERLRSQSSQLLAQYFSFQDFIRYGRTAVSTIIDLDTQLVDLRKTTKMNNEELEDFYKNAADIAKEMGVTTSEIISQASAWSRLGYNTKEASTQMAKLSSQFASISPGVSTDEAQTGLVSIMKAWDVDVSRVSRDIMDNINTLGNNFALTNGDIITGMEKAGATLSAIGTSIEDSFALFTGAQEVLQNAETVGVCLVA